MSYDSKYTGQQVEELLDQVANGEVGGGQQEVYVIAPDDGAAEVYAGLKAAWDAGVKVYYVEMMGITTPAVLSPTDDNAHTFELMYSLITTKELDATINSAIAVMGILQITAESITMLGSGQIPIGVGGIHVVNVNGDPATELAGLQAALAEKNQINLYDESFGGSSPCFIYGMLDGTGTEYVLLSFVTYVTGNSLSQFQYVINASGITKTNIGTRDTEELLITDYVSYPRRNSTDTTLEIAPNVLHVWGEMTALTITLGAEVEGRANEYLFQFTSGATATTLTLPSTLTWANGEALTPEANKTYQVSIVNGYAVYSAF